MKRVFLTYGTREYASVRKRAESTVRDVGGCDVLLSCGPEDLDPQFVRQNEAVFRARRGAGYWLWKPYLINRTLSELNEGDLFCYFDLDVLFLQAIDPLTALITKHGQDIIPFSLLGDEFVERKWTKREVFQALAADTPDIRNSWQCMATVVICRVSSHSRRFVKEWLHHCCCKSLIDDSSGAVEADDYIEHRHDQSIYSVLVKKNQLMTFRDPSAGHACGSGGRCPEDVPAVFSLCTIYPERTALQWLRYVAAIMFSGGLSRNRLRFHCEMIYKHVKALLTRCCTASRCNGD